MRITEAGIAVAESLGEIVEPAIRKGVKFVYWDYLDGGSASTTIADPLGTALQLQHAPYGRRGLVPPAPATTAGGNVITREVTVFSTVSHSPGSVTTGWNYQNGGSPKPFKEYCYYTEPSLGGAFTRVDLGLDGIRLPNIPLGIVPNLEGAIAKCQWWRG